jgi:hypothetical protein
MKTAIGIVSLLLLVAGCSIGFGGRHEGGSITIVPALPATVEIDQDQYYSQNGYYYRYQGNVWVYSQSREGPWMDLPRDHYPREVRYKGRDGHDNGNHENRGDDNRDNHDNGNRDKDNRDHDNRQNDNR